MMIRIFITFYISEWLILLTFEVNRYQEMLWTIILIILSRMSLDLSSTGSVLQRALPSQCRSPVSPVSPSVKDVIGFSGKAQYQFNIYKHHKFQCNPSPCGKSRREMCLNNNVSMSYPDMGLPCRQSRGWQLGHLMTSWIFMIEHVHWSEIQDLDSRACLSWRDTNFYGDNDDVLYVLATSTLCILWWRFLSSCDVHILEIMITFSLI